MVLKKQGLKQLFHVIIIIPNIGHNFNSQANDFSCYCYQVQQQATHDVSYVRFSFLTNCWQLWILRSLQGLGSIEFHLSTMKFHRRLYAILVLPTSFFPLSFLEQTFELLQASKLYSTKQNHWVGESKPQFIYSCQVFFTPYSPRHKFYTRLK